MKIDAYEQLFANCATMNQVNQVHIRLGNILTPGETTMLWRQMSDKGPPAHKRLTKERNYTLEDLQAADIRFVNFHKGDIDFIGKAKPEPYRRKELGEGGVFFSDGEKPNGKKLLVCYTGGSHRMMMPGATFLQALNAKRHDVLMLRDIRRNGFRTGIDGFGESPEEVSDGLVETFGFERYAAVHAMGCSAGGIPALLTALRLGLSTVLMVGMNGPGDPRWVVPGRPSLTETVRGDNKPEQSRYVTIAYGASVERDAMGARAFAELVPQTRVVEISLPDMQVPHVALHPLVRKGLLAAFLTEHLRLDA